jgi:hypothetical protein
MKNINILKNKIKIDYSKNLNLIEELVYFGMSEEERNNCIDLNVLKITETTINELIKTDLEIRGGSDVWLTKNLDTFYQIKLDHLSINEVLSKKILPRTKDSSLRLKIINTNIIISTLHRIHGVVLYNKTIKDNYPEDISSKINFTKGYLVCFSKECVDAFKNYEYIRKKVKFEPIIVKELDSKILTVLDALDNKNFSSPIWIKNINIDYKCINFLNVYNNILNDEFKSDKMLKIINFLNCTKIKIDFEIFNKIDIIANRSLILDSSIISKNTLKNNIYQIGKDVEEIIISDNLEMDNNNQIKNFINSAAVYELIKKQTKDIGDKVFYMNYLYDSRTRIYCENWPINYQLNHVVRNVILLEKKHNIGEIFDNFVENSYIKEIIKDYKVLLVDKIENETKLKLINYINNNFDWKIEKTMTTEEKIKIEITIIMIKKITEKIETNNDKSIIIGIELLEEFIKDEIENNLDKWTKKLKIKKIPLLVSTHSTMRKIKENIFDGMYWGDASSNAIQLITLRLGNLNEDLLMLTNISDNKTIYSNIYEYITEEIKKLDHLEIIKKINYKLTKKEIDLLQNNNDNKYRVMPASYGMGKHKNFKNMESLLQDRKEIWEKLNDKEKKKIADYFWEKTFEILKIIGFDLEHYKNICKKIGTCDIYTWYNDYGLPIVPINIKNSRRQKILETINRLKQEFKNETIEKNKEILLNKINKKKKEREYDDKTYWKRTMVNINKNNKKIYVRIYHPKLIIDSRETKQALIPNSIHSYDASVIAFVIELCEMFGIEIVIIHDSIGCNIIYAPIIKIIFKIANIIIISKNINKPPFPFDSEKTNKEYKLNDERKIKELIIKILESSNIFR